MGKCPEMFAFDCCCDMRGNSRSEVCHSSTVRSGNMECSCAMAASSFRNSANRNVANTLFRRCGGILGQGGRGLRGRPETWPFRNQPVPFSCRWTSLSDRRRKKTVLACKQTQSNNRDRTTHTLLF